MDLRAPTLRMHSISVVYTRDSEMGCEDVRDVS